MLQNWGRSSWYVRSWFTVCCKSGGSMRMRVARVPAYTHHRQGSDTPRVTRAHARKACLCSPMHNHPMHTGVQQAMRWVYSPPPQTRANGAHTMHIKPSWLIVVHIHRQRPTSHHHGTESDMSCPANRHDPPRSTTDGTGRACHLIPRRGRTCRTRGF